MSCLAEKIKSTFPNYEVTIELELHDSLVDELEGSEIDDSKTIHFD